MQEKKNINGIVMSGGKSRRMGRDKASIVLKGKTFLEHVVLALRPCVDDIIIVSNDVEHTSPNCTRIEDTIANTGPLSGLHAGLSYSEAENNLVVSCDVPLIQTEVLNVLLSNNAEDIDVVQFESQGQSVPLVALYKKRISPALLDMINQGERRLRLVVEQFNVRSIPATGKIEAYIQNINTKEDLKKIAYGSKD